MNIVVVGTGYVGLVTGTCLAELGHRVTCIDKDRTKIDRLRCGEVPIFEPGLEGMITRNAACGRLLFAEDMTCPARAADAVFIAVGTPQGDTDGAADLTSFFEAAADVARSIRGPAVIVTKSTVPAGTGDDLEALFTALNPAAGAVVASNPEFLREGSAIADFMHPDRIICGVEDGRARAVLGDIYAPLGTGKALVFTRRRNAELIKYASNAFLALKIAFINEMADLCEVADGDVGEIAHGMGLDRRIGPHFLAAGPGYGGSCFPKDTAALAHQARNWGTRLKLVETTIRSNTKRKQAMVSRIVKGLGGNVAGKKIAVLGLTFKANTDDMRESPALDVLPALRDLGARLSAYDPAGMETARAVLWDVEFCADPYAAAQSADALVVLTEWPQFRLLDPFALRRQMTQALIFDFRNLMDRQALSEAGFIHVGIGRALPPAIKETARDEDRIVPFKAHPGGRGRRFSGLASGRPAGEKRRAHMGGRQPADRQH